jgi:hypothetical protein
VPNENPGFVRAAAGFSDKSAGRGPGNVLAALRLCALSGVIAGLLTFGCGTHATLVITVPSSAVAGQPFTVTVTAMVGGSRDTIINSPIRFTSSDSAAVLPPIYYFNANDAGSHTFSNGVILTTAGSQSITATAVGASGLNGTANVTVSATTTATQFSAKRALQPGPRSQLSVRRLPWKTPGGDRLHRDSSLHSLDTAAFVPADSTFAWADNGRHLGPAAAESAFGLPTSSTYKGQR